jgi:hypothetical protein
MHVEVVLPGQPARIIVRGFATYGDNASYPVLACDPSTDRAIVAVLGQGIAPSRFWVFRLSTGAIVRTVNDPRNWVAASRDGRLIARTVPQGGGFRVLIEDADMGSVLKTIDGLQGQGFSGDGTLLVGIAPNAIVLLNWRSGTRIWSSTAGQYGGYLAEPAGQHMAIGIGFVGGSDQADVYIVGPDGSSVLLPEHIRAALGY